MIRIYVILFLWILAFFGGGGVVWYYQRNDVELCNLEWKTKIDDANSLLEKANAEKESAVRAAEVKATEGLATREAALTKALADLTAARASTPLSAPCDECRVPSIRVWGVQQEPAASPSPARKGHHPIRRRPKANAKDQGDPVSGKKTGVPSPGA